MSEKVGNEGQQPPEQPQQPSKPAETGQAGYYGWQYEQEQTGTAGQQPPVVPGSQRPIADMGSSLGYGQGTEYQYFEAQPSQSLSLQELRQARLQQLREERLRRQQRRMKPDATSIIQRKLFHRSSGARGPYAAPSQQPPSQRAEAPPGGPVPPAQFSPAMPSPVEISPSLVGPPVASPIPQASPAAGSAEAAESAQDTGMIQRARIGRATMILTAAYIVSRVFGLLRTILFAFVFGTGATSDAYVQAFLIPDTIFNMVAGGALGSAFIPVFTTYMVGEKDEKTAWHVANAALNLAIAIMMALALLAIIFAGQIIPLYNPKTPAMTPQEYSAHINLIILLARIMLLQAIILGGGVIVTSILQAEQRFLLPAVGTVLYNVGIIAGLMPGVFLAVVGHRNDTLAVYGATWGVVLGAALEVAIQIPGLIKLGMRYSFTLDWRHPGVIQIGRLMVPRIINAAMLSLSTFVDRYLISFLGVILTLAVLNGLITQYYQAFQLLLLPLNIFGMTVATAAFPTLAENIAKRRLDRFRATIEETLRSILFMAIPSSLGLIVLGLPIIQVLFEHGAFDLNDAILTTYPLAGFALGLAGLSAVEILTRSFYAMHDSKTPVIVSVGQFIFKIALSLILINVAVWGAGWGTAALAFSTSLASTLEAAMLLWLIQQRIGGLQLRQLAVFAGRVLLAALIMAVCVLILRLILDRILVTTSTSDQSGAIRTFLALIKLVIELFAGMFIYLRTARWLGIEELEQVRRILNRLKLSWI